MKPLAGENNWSEPVYFFDDRIDLLSYYGGQEDMISYAFSYFYSPVSQSAELWLGYDEDIRVYLNGEIVRDYSGIQIYGDGDIVTDKVSVDIDEGQNTLMVKTLHKYNDYSFALNICEPETDENYFGNRVAGLRFYTDPGQNPDTNITAITLRKESLPEKDILNCYPNPVNDRVIIEFDLHSPTLALVDIYDSNGRHVASLVNRQLPAGKYRRLWNINKSACPVYKGYYYCTLRTERGISTFAFLVI